MKVFQKLTAFLLAAMLLLSLGITAYASEDGENDTQKTVNIHIKNTISGATYHAYRLLDTTTSLKSVGCHDSVDQHLSTCYNIAYSIHAKYENLLAQIVKTALNADSVTDAQIMEYINQQSSADAIRVFADTVYGEIRDNKMEADIKATAGSTELTLENVDSGYWLIEEKITTDEENPYTGAYSLVMLDTAGSRNISIETKRDEPALLKYVRDNGMNYGQGADMQIGDEAEFLLVVDVPDPIGYDSYTYRIHDDLSAGLTMNTADAQDKPAIEIRLNNVTGTILDTAYYTYSFDSDELCEDCDFHVEVDIKKAFEYGVLKADDRLYIAYTAKLNEHAKIMVNGQNTENANPNIAWLEYSNNPYNEASTTISAKKTVYVWTMQLEVKKVDNADMPLTGARFVLSQHKDLTEADLVDKDEDGKPDGYEKLMPLINMNNNHYRIAPSGYTLETVYEICAGDVHIQGFDDQIEYYLYETAAPDGYNKLSEPVSIKFFAQYISNEKPLMAAGYPKVSVNTGVETNSLTANIVNQTGAELPSTGGIGTTIFYVLGGVLTVGALVLLITKKRMSTD